MKTFATIAILSLAAAASTAYAAEPQRYLLGTDEVQAQRSPTIVQKADGVIVATFTTVEGKTIRHTLTPTTDRFYGPFGEKVVVLTDVVPNP